jgi:hypothetical protein
MEITRKFLNTVNILYETLQLETSDFFSDGRLYTCPHDFYGIFFFPGSVNMTSA